MSAHEYAVSTALCRRSFRECCGRRWRALACAVVVVVVFFLPTILTQVLAEEERDDDNEGTVNSHTIPAASM